MGDDSPAQILMKKGRRGAAAHVHADCANNTSSAILGDVLDILLNPGKAIDEWETLDWMRWLMAGGRTPDEFSSIGKYQISILFLLVLQSFHKASLKLGKAVVGLILTVTKI